MLSPCGLLACLAGSVATALTPRRPRASRACCGNFDTAALLRHADDLLPQLDAGRELHGLLTRLRPEYGKFETAWDALCGELRITHWPGSKSPGLPDAIGTFVAASRTHFADDDRLCCPRGAEHPGAATGQARGSDAGPPAERLT